MLASPVKPPGIRLARGARPLQHFSTEGAECSTPFGRGTNAQAATPPARTHWALFGVSDAVPFIPAHDTCRTSSPRLRKPRDQPCPGGNPVPYCLIVQKDYKTPLARAWQLCTAPRKRIQEERIKVTAAPMAEPQGHRHPHFVARLEALRSADAPSPRSCHRLATAR